MTSKNSKADERGAWGAHIEFILTCVGYAVGLGNVWRFPYLCYDNGGGAFLIPYVCMLIFCGMPVFFFELNLGQFASLGPLAVWKVNPLFKGIGCAMVTVSILVGLYYNILMAYILYFFFASMNSQLPWTDCANPWNNATLCLTSDDFANKTLLNQTLTERGISLEQSTTPSEEFFYNQVLKLSSGVDDLGPLNGSLTACLALSWLVVFLVLLKGIKTLGKVVYFTSTFPYVMMLVMVIRGVTLEGSEGGIVYYLQPKFDEIGKGKAWSDAASQIFFTLSTCSGGLIAMASYNQFHSNTLRDSLLIPVVNCLTSLFAGFAIFSVLGFMAFTKGVDIDKVADSGPGLIFVVYPEALSRMPIAPLWSILFFFMMLTLGFSSQFSICECVFVAFIDEFADILRRGNRPTYFRAALCSFYFLISLPMVTRGGFYLFSIADEYAGGFPRLFIGVFELIAVVWVYGLNRFNEDVAMMLGKRPNIIFSILWTAITPTIITAIIIYKCIDSPGLTLFSDEKEYKFPDWANSIGWLMVAAVVIWIPLIMVVSIIRDRGLQSATPAADWGPALPEHRTGRYAKADGGSFQSFFNDAFLTEKL